MIIWGQWKSIYDEPIQLNISCQRGDQEAIPLHDCIVDMVSFQDFCLFVTEEGELFAMGQNLKAMLGLGIVNVSTGSMAKKIEFPGGVKVMSIKIGSSHVLALTEDGQVFGWGSNSIGQVGCASIPQSEPSNGSKTSNDLLWKPVRVYPMDVPNGVEVDDEYQFDRAIQIEAYQESSFLVTDEGALFSWGNNENGFLGRDIKPEIRQNGQQKQRSINFTNLQPGRVRKLEKFIVRRISVKDGKFMVFFADQELNDRPEDQEEYDYDEEDDENEDEKVEADVMSKKSSVRNKDSEADSDEERDTVNIEMITKSAVKGAKLNKSIASKKSVVSKSSRLSKGTRSSQRQSQGGFGKWGMGGKTDPELLRKYKNVSDIMKKTCELRDELVKFDRALSDSMKPLTDIQNRNIYDQVIDKFSSGRLKSTDAEELRMAIDRVQVKLKPNVAILDQLEQKVKEHIKQAIQARYDQAKSETNGLSSEEESLFQQLSVFADLLLDNITLKKLNLIGCKMKVYAERMKQLNFLELLTAMKEENDEMDQERQKYILHSCKQLCKKTQVSIKKNIDFYLQMHIGCSIPSSLALSVMSNSIYVECDLWSGLGTLSLYTNAMQDKLIESEQSHDKIRKLWQCFKQLEETDFNKKVKKYEERSGEFDTPKQYFDAIMIEIHHDINGVLAQVQNQMKENGKKDSKDVLYFFQTLIHDSALIRQMLYSAQQALFEAAESSEKQAKQYTPGTTPNGAKSQLKQLGTVSPFSSLKAGEKLETILDDRSQKSETSSQKNYQTHRSKGGNWDTAGGGSNKSGRNSGGFNKGSKN